MKKLQKEQLMYTIGGTSDRRCASMLRKADDASEDGNHDRFNSLYGKYKQKCGTVFNN